MEINKKTNRRISLKAFHDTPGDFHADYILLPLGYLYNREFLSAREGSYIKFGDRKVYPLLRAGVLSFKNPATEGLCFARYGITLKKALQIWRTNAFAQGYGRNAVSDEECLIIIYGKEDEE